MLCASVPTYASIGAASMATERTSWSTTMNPQSEQPSILRPGGWRAKRTGFRFVDRQYGRWGYILAWALGVPIPILLLVYLLRGCN
jgi:hypothetical protein